MDSVNQMTQKPTSPFKNPKTGKMLIFLFNRKHFRTFKAMWIVHPTVPSTGGGGWRAEQIESLREAISP